MVAVILILIGIIVMVFGIVMTVLVLAGPVGPYPSMHDPVPSDSILTIAIALGGIGLIVWGALL